MTSKRRGGAASDSSLVKVKEVSIFAADENGVLTTRRFTLYLDKREQPTFVFKVPPYVRAALGESEVPEQVNKRTAEEAEQVFAGFLRQFAEWKKNAVAEHVIVLDMNYIGVDSEGGELSTDNTSHFGHTPRPDVRRHVEVSYYHAFRVNGNLHQRVLERSSQPWPFGDDKGATPAERPAPVYVVGSRISSYDDTLMLPYSIELQAQLDRVCAALNQAVQVLHSIAQAKDVASALLGLGNGPLLLAGGKPS